MEENQNLCKNLHNWRFKFQKLLKNIPLCLWHQSKRVEVIVEIWLNFSTLHRYFLLLLLLMFLCTISFLLLRVGGINISQSLFIHLHPILFIYSFSVLPGISFPTTFWHWKELITGMRAKYDSRQDPNCKLQEEKPVKFYSILDKTATFIMIYLCLYRLLIHLTQTAAIPHISSYWAPWDATI